MEAKCAQQSMILAYQIPDLQCPKPLIITGVM